MKIYVLQLKVNKITLKGYFLDNKYILEKKLSKTFKKVRKPSYIIDGKDLCWECEERHSELTQGRQVTLDDIALSCYSYIFYEPNTFEFLIPSLLIKAMNKESDVHGIFPTDFLQQIRNKTQYSWFQRFSFEKKTVIINALKFINDLYYMQEYEVWDFDEERMVHFFEEEDLEKESKLSLIFWQELLNT
jgi:hypothetical protein